MSNKRSSGGDLPRRFARAALLYFVVVGVLGVFLRARYVTPLWPALQFANVVHAHSHVAYFGWASLGLMAVLYGLLPRVTGRPLQGLRWMRLQLGLTHVATVGALVFFTAGGYTPISIVFSTFNVLLWYFFLRIYRRNVAGLPKPWPVPLRYWHGAVVLLFASSLGTWLISAVTAAGGAGTVGHQAGLEIFLTNFTDGWLLLGLLGAAIAWLSPETPSGHRSPPADGWAATPLPWIVGLTPLTFLAELVPFDLPVPVLLLGLAARFGLALPYAWFLLGARRAYQDRRDAVVRGPFLGFVAVAAGFFVVKAVLHFALGIAAIVPTRHMLVAYLHLDLLGFVSAGLLAALYFIFGPSEGPQAAPTGSTAVSARAGAWILAVGVGAMVLVLAFVAIIGGASDPEARRAVADLLRAAFVFGLIAFVGVGVSVAGLWPHTASDPPAAGGPSP